MTCGLCAARHDCEDAPSNEFDCLVLKLINTDSELKWRRQAFGWIEYADGRVRT